MRASRLPFAPRVHFTGPEKRFGLLIFRGGGSAVHSSASTLGRVVSGHFEVFSVEASEGQGRAWRGGY